MRPQKIFQVFNFIYLLDIVSRLIILLPIILYFCNILILNILLFTKGNLI